mgnify:CR=1 FL=1
MARSCHTAVSLRTFRLYIFVRVDVGAAVAQKDFHDRRPTGEARVMQSCRAAAYLERRLQSTPEQMPGRAPDLSLSASAANSSSAKKMQPIEIAAPPSVRSLNSSEVFGKKSARRMLIAKFVAVVERAPRGTALFPSQFTQF